MRETTHGLLLFGRFALDLRRGCLRDGDREIDLPPKPFQVLRHLVAHAGRLVSKRELLEAVWPNVAVSDDSLTQCIRELRRQLGDNEHRLIRTVPRRGYLLDATVSSRAQFSADGLAIRHQEGSRLTAASAGWTAGVGVWRQFPFGIPRDTTAVAPNATAQLGSEKGEQSEASDEAPPIAASREYRARGSRSRAYWTVPVTYRSAATSFALLGALLLLFSALALATLSRSQPEGPAQPNRAAKSKIRCNPTLATVSVLPFTTSEDSGAASQLAERMSDDVRGYLSRIPVLRVIPRQEAWRVASSSVTSATPSLAAQYTVEGRVQSANGNVRLSMVLLQDGAHAQVWSSTFEHTEADWPLKQDEVAKHLAYTLHVETVRREGSNLPDNVNELSIQQLLGGGWAIMMGWGKFPHGHAERLFSEVLRRDPDCTSAMVGLAGSKILRASNLIGDPDKQSAEADALLREAYSRGSSDFTVHYYFGVLHNKENNVPAALQAYDRSLELNPTFATAHAYRARVLIKMGKYAEVLQGLETAYRLAGKVVTGWRVWQGMAELELGQDEAAGESFRKALAAVPDNPYANAAMAGYYALRGNLKAAAPHVDKVRKATPERSDQWRLLEFNKGHGDQPEGRLGDGVRRALEAYPQSQ